jgi:hypothetical protein
MTRIDYLRTVRRRRGAVLVAALVCLLVVMAVLSSMLQGTLRARRQLHRERDLRQAELLLQAGVERAAFRFASEPGYRGETWSLPAVMITGSKAGRVMIEFSRESDEQPWRVDVAAEYPAGNEASIRRSHTFNFQPQSVPTEE